MNRLLFPAILAAFLAFAATADAAGIYQRGNSADPVTLDPQRATTAAEANILRDILEGLTIHDAGGRVIPGAAVRWRVSDDGLTWTFTLRRTVWSNGDPVTAEDFVRTFRRLIDPKTDARDAPLFAAIANASTIMAGQGGIEDLGVTATGERTLEIRLDSPVPYLPELLARPSAMPVHRTTVAPGGAVPDPRMAVNGAFKISRFSAGSHLRLIANDRYHDAEEVALSAVIYRPYAADRAVSAFEGGTLHSNNDVPPFRIGPLREELTDRLHLAPYLGSFFFVFGDGDGPLADLRVRRALAMAADRDAIAADIWSGAMLPSTSLVPRGIAGYGEPAEFDHGPAALDERRAAAAALLAEAGIGPERPLTLRIRIPASELNRRTAAALIAGWGPLGVHATVIEAEAGEHYRALAEARDYDLASVAWIGDYNDASTFLELFRSGNEATNFARYQNPAYDGFLEEAANTQDREVRSALLFRADRELMGDLPVLPLLQYGSLNLVSPLLVGWEDNVLDIHPSRWLSLAEPPAAEDD